MDNVHSVFATYGNKPARIYGGLLLLELETNVFYLDNYNFKS